MPLAILDVDGTLVDTNYHHTVAWFRAFREHDVTLPMWRIHRAIGMGGDQLVEHLIDAGAEEQIGDSVRDAEKRLYGELIGEVRALDGSRELIVDLREHGLKVVLASSAKEEEIDHYLDLLDARSIVDAWTTSADVEATKPAPDLVHAALEKGGDSSAVMLGDTTWDVIAAQRAGIETVCVMTGGFGRDELEDAGARAVYESLHELREQLTDAFRP